MQNSLLNHRSIRDFSNEGIPQTAVDTMIDAACRASTTGNMQLYSIVLTTKDSLKQKLWEAHFKQQMVKQAPLVATFCADFNRFNKWCDLNCAKPGYDNFLSFFTAAIDALLAAQNFCIAAEELGYGICYLGTTTYMAKKISDILDLPNHVVPITTVVTGKPNTSPTLTDRLPNEAIVHHETYIDYTDERIKQLYAQKEGLEMYQKIVKDNGVENLAQVFTQKRYTKNDNVTFSNMLLELLRQKGFMNHDQ
ncbi:MAG: NADPH-dependent oxidoreductase [Bacteroidales bacterium]|nr:NADPH-dependent oxidoreductase [Bacteroidales bacterium]